MFQAGFLAYAPTGKPLPVFYDSETMLSGFAGLFRHQALTAARPSRIFTVFPFLYPPRQSF
jgi:hypothetical protein